jgi:omega-amidase
MSSIKVAACQMSVTGNVDANFEKIKSSIELAAKAGAGVIALPECALPGYPPHFAQTPHDLDLPKIAELNHQVCALAAEHKIWVILGSIIMSSDGLLNSALVISDKGELEVRYDKMHLMPDDKKFFCPGVGAWTYEIGDVRFGTLICYDARFPEPFRYLREQGAQVIVVILNACGSDTWKVPVLEGTFRTRASENSCFVVAVNAAGPLQMATSRICTPVGLDLASANQDREEMLLATIDTEKTDSGYFYDRRLDQFEVNPKFKLTAL